MSYQLCVILALLFVNLILLGFLFWPLVSLPPVDIVVQKVVGAVLPTPLPPVTFVPEMFQPVTPPTSGPVFKCCKRTGFQAGYMVSNVWSCEGAELWSFIVEGPLDSNGCYDKNIQFQGPLNDLSRNKTLLTRFTGAFVFSCCPSRRPSCIENKNFCP